MSLISIIESLTTNDFNPRYNMLGFNKILTSDIKSSGQVTKYLKLTDIPTKYHARLGSIASSLQEQWFSHDSAIISKLKSVFYIYSVLYILDKKKIISDNESVIEVAKSITYAINKPNDMNSKFNNISNEIPINDKFQLDVKSFLTMFSINKPYDLDKVHIERHLNKIDDAHTSLSFINRKTYDTVENILDKSFDGSKVSTIMMKLKTNVAKGLNYGKFNITCENIIQGAQLAVDDFAEDTTVVFNGTIMITLGANESSIEVNLSDSEGRYSFDDVLDNKSIWNDIMDGENENDTATITYVALIEPNQSEKEWALDSITL